MIEEVVQYDTAKSLDKKKFSLPTTYAYDNCGEIYHRDYIPHDFNIRGLLSAPTQAQVQTWFRNEHNLHITIHVHNEGWSYNINNLKGKHGIELLYSSIINSIVSNEYFKNYEEALETAILRAIEILK